MPINYPAVIAQIAGFGGFLWVGLYLLVRAPRRTPLIGVSLLGLFAQAAYFAASALADTTTNLGLFVALERGLWWAAVLPAVAWFQLSHLIAQQPFSCEHQRAPRHISRLTPILITIVLGVALGIALVGSCSDLFVDYSHAVHTPGGYTVVPGPAYPVYTVYLGLIGIGAIVNLVRAWRHVARRPDRTGQVLAQQLRLLTGGALCFLAGGLWIAAHKYWNLPLPLLPGFVCVFGGLAAFGSSIAHFGLLLEGQNIRRDFVYNFTGISLMHLLYVGLLTTTAHLSVGGLLLLVGLVTLTHTAFDNGRAVLDRLFFSRTEQTARAEARDYATALAAQPIGPAQLPSDAAPAPVELQAASTSNPPSAPMPDLPGTACEKQFKDAVRKALSGLKSPPRLAQSPLLGLALVERRVAQTGESDNRLNRVAALRELLIERIDGLRPCAASSAQVGDAWRFYNVLYYPYVRELSRKAALAEARRLQEERRRAGQREPSDLEQVLTWLTDVDEDTFYKWQRRASDLIAALLWEENHTLEQLGQADTGRMYSFWQ